MSGRRFAQENEQCRSIWRTLLYRYQCIKAFGGIFVSFTGGPPVYGTTFRPIGDAGSVRTHDAAGVSMVSSTRDSHSRVYRRLVGSGFGPHDTPVTPSTGSTTTVRLGAGAHHTQGSPSASSAIHLSGRKVRFAPIPRHAIRGSRSHTGMLFSGTVTSAARDGSSARQAGWDHGFLSGFSSAGEMERSRSPLVQIAPLGDQPIMRGWVAQVTVVVDDPRLSFCRRSGTRTSPRPPNLHGCVDHRMGRSVGSTLCIRFVGPTNFGSAHQCPRTTGRLQCATDVPVGIAGNNGADSRRQCDGDSLSGERGRHSLGHATQYCVHDFSALSSMVPATKWTLRQQVCDQLFLHWGRPMVDLFATRTT